jgi:hypothetical protein
MSDYLNCFVDVYGATEKVIAEIAKGDTFGLSDDLIAAVTEEEKPKKKKS